MQRFELKSLLEQEPVIAAVGDEQTREAALACPCKIVFVLYGDLCNITQIVSSLKDAGKMVFVHIDLVAGLAAHEVAVRFLRQYTQADGVISTRPNIVKAAKEQGFVAVHRFFMLDSHALANIEKSLGSTPADMVEVLPAVQGHVIKRLCEKSRLPIIVGGLITQKDDVLRMLEAGADAISTTAAEIWEA